MLSRAKPLSLKSSLAHVIFRAAGSGRSPDHLGLLDRNGLGEIARLVDVGTLEDRDMVGEEL